MVEIATHGTLDYAELAELNLSPDDLLIFSSNMNPYGPPEAILEAVRQATTPAMLARYPDRLSLELRALVAQEHAVSPESVVIGNGTADLMWIIGLLYMANRRIAILSPTFSEYENVASLVKAPVTHIPLPEWSRTRQGHYTSVQADFERCTDDLRSAQPDVIFLCNPNNPTGRLYSPNEFAQLVQAAPNALWIVDEAYMAFTPTPWSASEWLPDHSVIILRSMTKDFALGGLRLGYLVAQEKIARAIQTAQSPWNVNIMAQVAGGAALQNLEWRAKTLKQLALDTERLRQDFQQLALDPMPTTANYFLTPIDNPTRLRAYLLQHKIMIRDCTSFGLPTYFRVATQQPEANQLLVQSLQDYLQENQP